MKGSKTRILSVIFLLLTVFFLSGQVCADENAGVGDYAYARIFTAKVPNGLSKSTDELAMIAREYGTEEILSFQQSGYPEKKLSRYIVRFGSKQYAYPGFTVKTRGHIARQKSLGKLEFSKDNKIAKESMMGGRVSLQWELPDSVDKPLKAIVTIDKQVIPMTVHEISSLSGDKRWPKVIRIDVKQRDGSIIQVFEYLDKIPEESATQKEKAFEAITTSVNTENLSSSIMQRLLYPGDRWLRFYWIRSILATNKLPGNCGFTLGK